MAFRPRKEETNNSIGYRLSSDRQPGIGIANNMTPQYANPIERMPFPFPRPGQGKPAPMPMPDRDFDFRRNMPLPMPMPSPDRRFDFRRDMPMPSPMPVPPPGMGPFSPEPFPPMAPFMEQAAVDPSDYRTILKMIEAGLNPDDYMEANRGGIASLLR